MRYRFALSVLILIPGVAHAQAPGTRLTVDVTVTAVSLRGDTATATYLLQNRASSVEQLYHFTVDAPAPVLQIVAPQPAGDWTTSVQYRGRSVAEWVVLGDELGPGQQSPPLVFEARGLPTIVTYWIRGYVPPDSLTSADTLPIVPPTDPLVESSLADSTVGVEPFPVDLSAGNLLMRLRGLLDQACGGLGWIGSSAVCATLGLRLDSASQAVSGGDTAGARTQLADFLTDLEAQHGAGLPVNDTAYWLLKVNGEFIPDRR
jgi:hypothetical protein